MTLAVRTGRKAKWLLQCWTEILSFLVAKVRVKYCCVLVSSTEVKIW